MDSQQLLDGIRHHESLTEDARTLHAVKQAQVAQKDVLLTCLNLCCEVEDFSELLSRLEFVAAAWKATGYGYKLVELVSAAIDRMYQRLADARDMRDSSRRNFSQQKLWDAEVKAFDALIASACILRT